MHSAMRSIGVFLTVFFFCVSDKVRNSGAKRFTQHKYHYQHKQLQVVSIYPWYSLRFVIHGGAVFSSLTKSTIVDSSHNELETNVDCAVACGSPVPLLFGVKMRLLTPEGEESCYWGSKTIRADDLEQGDVDGVVILI